MIDKELLQVLACPVCKQPVEPTKDGKGLKCVKCGRIYPIREGIPIMLEEEAYFEGEEGSPPEAEKTR